MVVVRPTVITKPRQRPILKSLEGYEIIARNFAITMMFSKSDDVEDLIAVVP